MSMKARTSRPSRTTRIVPTCSKPKSLQEGETTMKCQRCDGLMVVDHYIDMEDDSGHLWLRAWRCITCGEVLDSKIYRHRLIQSSIRDRVTKVIAQKKAKKSREAARVSA